MKKVIEHICLTVFIIGFAIVLFCDQRCRRDVGSPDWRGDR